MQVLINAVDVTGRYTPEELGQISITFIADMAETGTGTMPVPDDTSSLSYFSGAEFQLHDGAIPILNGYIGADVVSRGSTAGGARRLSAITIADENAYLWGARAYNWHRPAETDRARILAYKAKFLPDLNTTWVLNTNTKSLPAKTYTTEEILTDLLGDLADVTGKTMFVVNRDLHWHLYTEGDTAGLAISDDDTEYDYFTTFPPMSPSATRDPSELRNNVLAYNDKGQTYRATDAASLSRYDSHIRHQGLISVPNGSPATLEAQAKGVIARASQERVTYECDIGPLTAAQVALIPKGSLISVTSAVMGLNHSTQRVAQIGLTYQHPGQYHLHLTFAYPIRRVAAPKPPPPVTKPVPFVPGGVSGAITFIQAAKTADATAAGDATFASPATAGHLLVLVTEPDQPGGVTPSWDSVLEAGWIHDVESDGITDDSGGGSTLGRLIASKDAEGGETLVEVRWGAAGTVSGATTPNGMVVMAEYETSDNLVLQSVVPFAVQDDGLGTTTLPPVSPTAGATALIVWLVGFHPNYAPTVSAGWNIRGSWDATGGSRLRLMMIDRIVANASGAYSGTLTSPGGTDSTGWVLGGAVYEMGGSVPVYGQPVGPEGGTGDGVSTARQTNYPYQPGSLVFKVNGVITAIIETDPETGLFNLVTPDAPRANESWTYLGTDGDPTGATNPPPSGSTPAVPTDPGQMPGGDGVYRPPIQPYVPAEPPDGSRLIFTIVPYVAGQATSLSIGTQAQRKGIDWWELNAAAGTVEFSEAPLTGEEITVWAMPLVATPPVASPSVVGLYGPGLQFDSKSNFQMGPQGVVAILFTAGASDDLISMLIQARGGSTYSGGTGGAYSVVVKAADANGYPTGSALATATYTPGNPGGAWTSFDTITWSTPASLVLGDHYCVVLTNTDGAPNTNYVSLNNAFVFGAVQVPRQPRYADSAFGLLSNPGSGWVVHRQGGDFTPNVDLTYAGGHHDGQGYVQNMETTTYSGSVHVPGVVNGPSKLVRERFTVSGGDRPLVSVAIRGRRTFGNDPITVKLKSGATVLATVVIPASAFPQTDPYNDDGGSAWGSANWAAIVNIANAGTYDLELSCPATTQFTFAPIRKGTDNGFDPSLVFGDGQAEFSTNSGASYAPLYPFDTDAPDLQFYFRVATT